MFDKLFPRRRRLPASANPEQTSTHTTANRTPAMITGQHNESLAEQFLLQQGLTLITRNYRCKAGEIDLVMQDGPHLVFVEVRFRTRRHYGSASESVTPHKQRKLIRAAETYLLDHFAGRQLPACRFDVVAIDGARPRNHLSDGGTTADAPANIALSSTNPRQNPIEWIPDAFTA